MGMDRVLCSLVQFWRELRRRLGFLGLRDYDGWMDGTGHD